MDKFQQELKKIYCIYSEFTNRRIFSLICEVELKIKSIGSFLLGNLKMLNAENGINI